MPEDVQQGPLNEKTWVQGICEGTSPLRPSLVHHFLGRAPQSKVVQKATFPATCILEKSMAVLAGFCAGKCIEHLLSGRDAQFLIQGSLLYTMQGSPRNQDPWNLRTLGTLTPSLWNRKPFPPDRGGWPSHRTPQCGTRSEREWSTVYTAGVVVGGGGGMRQRRWCKLRFSRIPGWFLAHFLEKSPTVDFCTGASFLRS